MSYPTKVLTTMAAGGACALALLAAAATTATAETTRERILAEKKIVIGVHNRAPWGYRDADGNPAGFHPDLVTAAFKTMGVTDIELVIADFGALIPGLVAKRFDMIASGLYITPKRCELVSFSDPDLKLADAAIVHEGNPKNIHGYADIAKDESVKFGGTRGSVTTKNALAAGVPESRMLMLQNTEATISALKAGRVDVIAFSAPTTIKVLADPNIKGVERAMPFTGLMMPDGREKSGYSAVAFRKADADLRDLYNSRLNALKADGTVTGIMKTYSFSDEERAPDGLTYSELCKG